MPAMTTGLKSLSLAAGLAASAAAEEASDWHFSIEPYLLASSIEGDASIGRITGVPVDVGFDDVLDSLDVGAMVHFEAIRNDRWGVVLDYGFMDLSGSVGTARGGVIAADVRQGVLEAFVLRRISQGDADLDIFGGVRWWDNEVGANIDLALLPGSRNPKLEEDWVDPVIGIRRRQPVGDQWDLMLRGDIGGFGVSSDFTAAVGVNFLRELESFTLDIGYRATWVDFEDGTPGERGFFAYDTVTHGPVIGLIFDF